MAGRMWIRTVRCLIAAGLCLISAIPVLAQQAISAGALQQIDAISAAKANFSEAQKKVDSNLLFAAMASRGDAATASFQTSVPRPAVDGAGNVTVDIRGTISPALAETIGAAGGFVLDQSARWGLMRASLPLGALEAVAARPDVKSIRKAAIARTNAGSLTTQGYVTHSANLVVNNQGITGAGVTVGVLSDSASPARIAALIASGDLPATTTVLPGQAGPSDGADEGTAMMEIIHDMAPGANLIFATAFDGEASFASNILALQAAGCKVIVDDVTYSDEGAFQDGPVAQAVNQAVANGAIYFSSAANSGNLTFHTSGTWEGDFRNGGALSGVLQSFEGQGRFHNFGTAANPQNFDVITAATSFITLQWSDPLGASANDYDLFALDSTGTVLKAFSASAQTGTQDPIEFIGGDNCGTPAATGYCAVPGDRIVVVLYSGAARALRVDTSRGQLSIATSGSTFGHNAGLNTVSMAATFWNSAKIGTRPFSGAANPIEVFSSDGPRKIFYNPDGSAITPGNVLFSTGGGITLQKPDLTAADGITARTPGFNPFFGTSAAAPHAAGVAALILQLKPAYTPAQTKAAMINGTVDTMAPGVDRDSGYGIVMATLAVQYAATH